MPAVKLLSDEKIEEIQKLREQGLTIRSIAKMSGIPRATVHHYVRDVDVKGSATVLSGRVKDVRQLGIHIPFNLVCPDCGLEQPHITLCLDCGAIWMGTCGHGGEVVGNSHRGVDLGTAEKRPGDSYLHIHVLETGGSSGKEADGDVS